MTSPKKLTKKRRKKASRKKSYTLEELTSFVMRLDEFVDKSIDNIEDEILNVSRDFETRIEELEENVNDYEDRIAELESRDEACEEDDANDDDDSENEEFKVVLKVGKTLRYQVRATDKEAAIAAAGQYYDSDAYNPYDDDDAYVESFLGEDEEESIEDSWVEE